MMRVVLFRHLPPWEQQRAKMRLASARAFLPPLGDPTSPRPFASVASTVDVTRSRIGGIAVHAEAMLNRRSQRFEIGLSSRAQIHRGCSQASRIAQPISGQSVIVVGSCLTPTNPLMNSMLNS